MGGAIKWEIVIKTNIDGKKHYELSQSMLVRNHECLLDISSSQSRSGDGTYDVLGWDTPGDTPRIHVNFGNSREKPKCYLNQQVTLYS